jgi:DNA adenine methylase
LIALKDHEETLFYLDPPYSSSDCGHYKGYTLEDFEKMLKLLSTIKGKFILSSYPEEILLKYREQYGWKTKDIKHIVNVSGKREGTKFKTECITYNFIEPAHQSGLFDATLTTETISDEQD